MAHRKDDIRDKIRRDTQDRDLPREDANLEFVGFRMNPMDTKALRRHFSTQGINLSTGIRMILIQYMQTKGIR